MLLILVVVVLLTVFWTTTYWAPPPFPWWHPPPETHILGDLETYYTVQTVISTINITLLVFLFITYIGIYRKTGSQFTIGLIIFSLVMLLNVLASNPLVRGNFGYYARGLGPFAMLPDVFTLAALIILLYLTIEY
jgi:hypothetical protein